MHSVTRHSLLAGLAGCLIAGAAIGGLATDGDRFAGGRGVDLLIAGLALSGTAGLALAAAELRH
jgi:hypothetical protein